MDRPRFRWIVPILITVGFRERNKMLYNRSEKKTVNTIFLCGQRYRDQLWHLLITKTNHLNSDLDGSALAYLLITPRENVVIYRPGRDEN